MLKVCATATLGPHLTCGKTNCAGVGNGRVWGCRVQGLGLNLSDLYELMSISALVGDPQQWT